MKIRKIVKALTGVVVSLGVSMVVDNLIDQTTPNPEEENNKIQTITNLILLTTGKMIVSGMVSKHATDYANGMVDDVADVLVKLIKPKV